MQNMDREIYLSLPKKYMTMRKVSIMLVLITLFIGGLQAGGDLLTPQRVFDLKNVAEVSISPNKQYIAYTLNVPREFTHPAGGDFRELYIYDRQNQDIIPFMTGNRNIVGIGWTPGGDAVTFRASLPDLPGMQVYAMRMRGGEAYPLTKHNGSINSYAFIDENTLAIVAAEGGDPIQADLRRKGFDIEVYEEEFRHLNLYTYDIQNHKTRQITKDVTVFDFVLSPDKNYAAAAIAPRNLVDDSYMFKRIHLVDMKTGKSTLIMENPGKLGNMSWSPDGTKLAFRSASKLEDSVVGSLFVMDVPTEKQFVALHNYVKDMELSVIDFVWKDNNTLIYAAEEGVDIVLSEQDISLEEVPSGLQNGINTPNQQSPDVNYMHPARRILIGPDTIYFGGFTQTDGMIAFAGHTWQHPAELFTFDLETKNLTRLTNHNPWLEDIQLGQQSKLVYSARDEMTIEGVLIYPVDYEVRKKYPLIVYIHGGPEAAVKNGWNTAYSIWGQVAAARGYFVFMPNYRASSGRGVDFTMAGYADLVGVEYEDVLDGIDHLIDIGYVDRDRVGMGGGSYGGYFSAWSATRYSDRFAASVVFVGISNQISKRNTTDIPWEDYHVHWGYWTHENWEDVYNRSPIKYASHSLTPTLILHGYEDPRVPPSQGLELYRELKLHGKAPVRLIWYKGEGHGNRKNVHRLDYLVRTMEWFDYYLNPGNNRQEMPVKYPDYGVW
jgi:dipeptidyl aminopeptidase/acylaminoacyl peptidase